MSVQALRSTFGPNCHWCGLPMDFEGPRNAPESATIEHLHDATVGGVRKQSHRRLAHAVCNQTRNAFRQQAERNFKAWIEKRIDDLRAATVLGTSTGASVTTRRDGGCLCGSVRFFALGEPTSTLQCHCRFCQRMTGSTSYPNSVFAADAVQFSGEPMASYTHISEYSSKQVHVHFCPRCGTTVSLTFERWPGYRAISRGAFDDPNSVSIGAHIWTSSAQTGVVLPAGIDCFEFARMDQAGSPQVPARFDAPQSARTGDA